MPLENARMPFEASEVRHVPDVPGVFVLWCADLPVHVGATSEVPGVRALLERHLTGAAKPNKKQITHFSYELTLGPDQRRSEVVAALRSRGYVVGK